MDREAFLARLRGRASFRAGPLPPVPEPNQTPSIDQFQEELSKLDGHFVTAPAARAADALAEIVAPVSQRTFSIGRTALLASLGLRARLLDDGWREIPVDEPRAIVDAAVGVVEADCAISESGSVAFVANPKSPRLLSCLPPLLVVVLDPARLLARLEDFPPWLRARGLLPSSAALVSGPSGTGDIDQRYVVGAHGPVQLHVLVVEN